MADLPTIEADLSELETRLAAQGLTLEDLRSDHLSKINAAHATAWDALDDAGEAASRGYEAEIAAKTYADQKIQQLRDELGIQVQGVRDYVDNDFTENVVKRKVEDTTSSKVNNYRDRLDNVYALADKLGIDMADIQAMADQIANVDLPEQFQWLSDLDLAVLALTGKLDNWGLDLGLDDLIQPVLTLETDTAPEGRALLIASATSPTPIERWVFELSQDGGENFGEVSTSGPTKTWNVARGHEYHVRVTGYRRSLQTPVSETKYIVAFRDNTPPAKPTGLKVTGAFGGFVLTWNANDEGDFSHYEVREEDSSTRRGNGGQFSTATSTLMRNGFAKAVTRYYWIRALDTSGNASGWHGPVSDKSIGAGESVRLEDLEGVIDATKFAQGIEPVSILGSVPSSKRTEVIMVGGQVYRWKGGKYVDDVMATQIVGKLVAGQIGAGAVRTEQLAAGAATISKLGVLDFENLFTNGSFEDAEMAYSGDYTYSGRSDTGARSLLVKARSSDNYVSQPNSAMVPVQGDAEYWGETAFHASGSSINSGAYARIRWYDGNKDSVGYTDIAANKGTVWRWKKYTREIVSPSNARYAKFQGINTNSGGNVEIDRVVLRRRNAGELVVDGTIKATKIDMDDLVTELANIETAYITNAHILEDLHASRLKVDSQGNGLPVNLQIGRSGASLGSVEGWAYDPAKRVNDRGTQIGAGKIVLSGGNSVQDWEYGNTTEINGGKLRTGTVITDKIDLRGVTDFKRVHHTSQKNFGVRENDGDWFGHRALYGVYVRPGYTLSVYIDFATTGSSVANWGVRIKVNGTVVREIGNGADPQPIVSISGHWEADVKDTVPILVEAFRIQGEWAGSQNFMMRAEVRKR